MAAQLGIWASVLISAFQSTYYASLLKSTEQLIGEGNWRTRPGLLEAFSIARLPPDTFVSKVIKKGPILGLLLGFGLTWPIANSVGRRNGLLWSNLFLLKALFFQWTSFLLKYQWLLLPARLCIAAQFGLQFGLYLLYIYETCPRGWRAFVLVAIFLVRSLISTLSPWADAICQRRYFGAQEAGWPWPLTFALIPATIQAAALLLCCVESPGWTAVQAGDPAQAHADAQSRLLLSPSDMEDLQSRDDVEIDGVRNLSFELVAISLVLFPFNGRFHTDRLLLGILEKDPDFNELTDFYLILVFIILALGVSLVLGSRLSGKGLYFGSLLFLITSAFARILLVLIPLFLNGTPKSDPNTLADEMWGTVAYWVYVIDGLAVQLSGFLVTSLFILLMELGGQRGRVELIMYPLLAIWYGFLILDTILVGPVSLTTPELLPFVRNVADFLPQGLGSLGLKWSARLGLNVILTWRAVRLWGLVSGEYNKTRMRVKLLLDLDGRRGPNNAAAAAAASESRISINSPASR